MKALKIISFFIALIGLSVMFALLILFLPLYYAISLIAIVAIIVMFLLYVMIKENAQDNREEKVWHLIEDNPYDLPRNGQMVLIWVNYYIFNAIYEDGGIWLKVDGYPVGKTEKGELIFSSSYQVDDTIIAWMEIPEIKGGVV